MRSRLQTSEYDAGLDWVTATGDVRLERIGHKWVFGGLGRVRPWKFLNYTGRIGNNVAVGVNLKQLRFIVMAWGNMAKPVYEDIAHIPSARCTRLDMQITAAIPRIDIQGLYNDLKDIHNVSIILSRRGSTLYVGSRNSERFGRLYDKGAEAFQRPGELYRYELEYKRATAHKAFMLLRDNYQDRQNIIISNVCEFFENHGIPVPEIKHNSNSIIHYATVERDDIRTINWIRLQVIPALRRLQENGHNIRELLLDIFDGIGDENQITIEMEKLQLPLWPLDGRQSM